MWSVCLPHSCQKGATILTNTVLHEGGKCKLHVLFFPLITLFVFYDKSSGHIRNRFFYNTVEKGHRIGFAAVW